jgi:septal ring factor EnvC (AmiA/AmiB activator)
MTDPSAIDAATRRLTQALDALQAAVARKRDAETGGDAITMQLQALGNDRARLAADLDTAAARIRQLEDTNREVSRRIDVAMSTIEKLLDEHDR